MKKRLFIFLVTVTFLLTLTATSFADLEVTLTPCSTEDCGSNLVVVTTIKGETQSYSRPCTHYPYGTDVVYYRYDDVFRSCYDCHVIRSHKEVYVVEGIECHGSDLAP